MFRKYSYSFVRALSLTSKLDVVEHGVDERKLPGGQGAVGLSSCTSLRDGSQLPCASATSLTTGTARTVSAAPTIAAADAIRQGNRGHELIPTAVAREEAIWRRRSEEESVVGRRAMDGEEGGLSEITRADERMCALPR